MSCVDHRCTAMFDMAYCLLAYRSCSAARGVAEMWLLEASTGKLHLGWHAVKAPCTLRRHVHNCGLQWRCALLEYMW